MRATRPPAGERVVHLCGTRSGTGNFVAGTVPPVRIIDDTIGRKWAWPIASQSADDCNISYNDSSISFSGSNGTALITYRILSATNLVNPTWFPVLTMPLTLPVISTPAFRLIQRPQQCFIAWPHPEKPHNKICDWYAGELFMIGKHLCKMIWKFGHSPDATPFAQAFCGVFRNMKSIFVKRLH